MEQDFLNMLSEIFRFNKMDLNFGIYRILRMQRDRIQKFLQIDLLHEIDISIDKLKQNSPDCNPESIKQMILSNLITFFGQYYIDGDFIPIRRFSQSSQYMVPYNGEEILLHWASKDTYYTKTDSTPIIYEFVIDPWHIKFEIQKILSKQTPNVLTSKFYVLEHQQPFQKELKTKHLKLNLVYRALLAEEQSKYSSRNIQNQIFAEITDEFLEWLKIQKLPNGDQLISQLKIPMDHKKDSSNPSIMTFHLINYTTKTSYDFFLHKNLERFLLTELEIFSKIKLAPIITSKPTFSPFFAQDLANFSWIMIFQHIATQIVTFLGQIEQFQKYLYEKRKFITATNFLVSIALIPEELYANVLQNQNQLEEWKNLYSMTIPNAPMIKQIAFLKENPTLVVDTQYFAPNFKESLLNTFDNLEEKISGIALKSENFQALNLLSTKYSNQIGCTYIDPPYNTGSDEFIYKDRFQHSSWLSLMANLLPFMKTYSTSDGNFFISIDDNEYVHLSNLVETQFKSANLFGPIIIQMNKGGRDYLPIAKTHEYIICGSTHGADDTINEVERETKSRTYKDEKGEFEIRELRNRNPKFTRANRKNLFYPIFIAPSKADEFGLCPISLISTNLHKYSTVPLNQKGIEGCWRWGSPKVAKNIDPHDPKKSEIVAKQKDDGNWNIYEKYRKETTKIKSIWDDSAIRTENGTICLRNLFGKSPFDHPKPVELIERCIQIGSSEDDTILDFFAGSGTTAHAVLHINQTQNSHRKFIVIEMGDHFESILLPRIKKVGYSSNWKDGKPQDLISGQNILIKYQTLEQFQDTMNNIEIKSIDGSNSITKTNEYLIKNALTHESRANPVLIRIEDFAHPFHYSLSPTSISINQNHADLVETFNYLLGLQVIQQRYLTHQSHQYCIVFGSNDSGQILIIWRDVSELDLHVDKQYIESEIIPKYPSECIYINSQHMVNKAHNLEPIFSQLMGINQEADH